MTKRKWQWMEPAIALVAILFVPRGIIRAQNLVPNPSFEEYTECPPALGWAQMATGWMNLYTHSADYFNVCAGGTGCAVPFNETGYQWPADGDAYMGLATYDGQSGGDYREIIGAELTEPLQIGVPVYLSFMTSPGGGGTLYYNSAYWTSKGVGMKFFVDLPTNWQFYLYPNSAALYLDHVLTDTLNWTTVSGTYVPDSAYRYVVLTNFFENALSDAQVLDPTGYGIAPVGYSFLDQVCVSYDPAYCGNWHEVDEWLIPLFSIFPNPFAESLVMSGVMREDLDIQCLDALGRTLWSGKWPAGQPGLEIRGEGLPSGLLTFRVNARDGRSRSVPVVHVSP